MTNRRACLVHTNGFSLDSCALDGAPPRACRLNIACGMMVSMDLWPSLFCSKSSFDDPCCLVFGGPKSSRHFSSVFPSASGIMSRTAKFMSCIDVSRIISKSLLDRSSRPEPAHQLASSTPWRTSIITIDIISVVIITVLFNIFYQILKSKRCLFGKLCSLVVI